jgi:hypothetical protein
MMKLISKRGNLSAPGLDGITFPFIKLEKESAAEMLITMLRFIIIKRRIQRIWKTDQKEQFCQWPKKDLYQESMDAVNM